MLISVILVTMATNIGSTQQSIYTEEQRLLSTLLNNYSINARPVKNASLPAKVDVFMEIIRIDSVSEKGQAMRTKFHVLLTWENQLLRWDPSDYGDVDEILIPQSNIWTPPIYLFNEASRSDGDNIDLHYDHTVVVSYDGNCSLSYAQFYKSTCEINVSYFPFDEQLCELIFGSWGMDERLLLLRSSNQKIRSKNYQVNGEWSLDSAIAREIKLQYRVQKRNHSVIKIDIHIKRKYLFFVMNLIIPCALIACMIFLVFVLPPKSGERIALAITVMLSMAIFQELSSEKLPTSSDNYPLLGIYYSTSMFEIGVALTMNCFILNLYYRNYEMPPWVRRLVLGKLARIVRVDVPECRKQAYIDKENAQASVELTAINETNLNDSTHASNGVDPEGVVSNGKTDITYFHATAIVKEDIENKQKRKDKKTKYRSKKSKDGYLSRRNTIKTSQILDDQLRSEGMKLLGEDWKLAARVMDRVMLFLSVTIGVLSCLIIFCQAPRVREMLTL